MDLTKFKSSDPVRNFNSLVPGRHDVKVTRVAIFKSDRIKDFGGTLKTKDELDILGVDYEDTQQQLAIIFTDDKGANVVHRFNTAGFKRYEELADPKGFFKSAHPEGYAVSKETRKRVVSKKNSDACKNILDDFFSRCENLVDDTWTALPKGSTPDDLLGCRLSVEVKAKKYQGRDVSPDVRAFRPHGFKGASKARVEVPEAKVIDDAF